MPTNTRTEAEQTFWDERFAQAWEQCLKENGLLGAIGCAHLCRDAADAAESERRKSAGSQP
jgi:hypothetical protein